MKSLVMEYVYDIVSFCYTMDTGPCLDSTWLSSCCPVSWRSCSFGSAGLAQPLYMLQQIIEGVDVGGDQLITLILGLGSCRVGQLPGLLCFCYQGKNSRIN